MHYPTAHSVTAEQGSLLGIASLSVYVALGTVIRMRDGCA